MIKKFPYSFTFFVLLSWTKVRMQTHDWFISYCTQYQPIEESVTGTHTIHNTNQPIKESFTKTAKSSVISLFHSCRKWIIYKCCIFIRIINLHRKYLAFQLRTLLHAFLIC